MNPDEPPKPAESEDSGNPFYRGALTVTRLVGGCFILVTILDAGVDWLRWRREGTPPTLGRALYDAIPLVIGVVVLVVSSAIAERVSDYLDE